MQRSITELSVLVIDDDEAMRYGLSRVLKKCGCVITEKRSVEDALDELSTSQFDIVFSDMRFPCGMDGEMLLEIVIDKFPNTHLVLVSCSMDSERKSQLTSKGASFCLQKPVFEAQCRQAIASLGGMATLTTGRHGTSLRRC